MTYDKLLPGYSSYPEAPAVTASTGWQFAGWSPEYDKSGTIEATVQESQMYTATYRGQGTLTYDGLVEYVAAEARRLGVEAEFYQSNHEGDLVTAIQQAYGRMDGIVINAGAYTHTSIAILDALKAVSVPAAEVHISDVAKREDFRQVSYLGMACCCKFAGEGKQGYVHAMEKLIEIIRSKNT